MAEQKVKLTDLPAATDTIDTAQLLINQNSTDQKLPVTHFLRGKNNLSDLADIVQSRANLDVPSVDEVNDKLSGLFNGNNSFTAGASLASRSDFIWDENSKSWYYWSGTLPKDVPAASTPESTGGIGAGAWVSVGDAALRSQLALPGGAGLIGTENSGTVQDSLDTLGLANDLASLNEMMASKNALLIDDFTVADAFSIPSFTKVSGIGFRIGFIGSSTLIDKTIKKTTNSTITLSNQDPNAGSQTVDCIAYVEPVWPSLSVYPQKTTIEDISFCGAAPSITQAGLFILQGAGWSLNRIDAVNVINGIWAKDIWLSSLDACHTMGKIRIDGGTSLTINNCWGVGHVSRPGAIDLSAVKYSTLNSCASDNAVNTAYHFDSCQGVTMNSCGCEGANTTTANNGTAITFATGNNMVVNGFTCVPVASQPIALIAVGNNNNVEFNGFESSFGITYNRDLYVYGNGSKIVFNNSRFGNGALPSVEFASGSTSVVTVNVNGNSYIYTAPVGGGVQTAPEIVYLTDTWTPLFKIGGSSSGITYTSTGRYTKNGNLITASFSVILTNKGASSGIVTIEGLPLAAKASSSATISLYSALVSAGPIGGVVDQGSSFIIINNLSSATVANLTNANISNTTRIDGVVTYQYDSLLYR